jgi:IS605 OrfB family transposase
MHWNICNYLIKSYDVIFFGDIKSHNIVKKSYNKTLNRNFNDLKFYKFKQRLLYKGIMNNKKVFFINEAFTSQGRSTCGKLWKQLGKNKIYTCQNKLCKKVFDRDYNAAKNICMKGLLSNN